MICAYRHMAEATVSLTGSQESGKAVFILGNPDNGK